jgi:MFS family permease
MALAFGLAGFAVTGPMLHLVAMLSDRGMSPATAAAASSTVGLALLGGRVMAGHLMDRFFAPFVAVGFVLGSAIGLLALASGASGPLAFAAAVLIGLTAGAEIDVIAFLCSRYFGLRSFGEIYGWQYATYSAAAGTAPIATAIGFDLSGSYQGVLYAFAGLLLLSAVLLARLPRYDRPALAAA